MNRNWIKVTIMRRSTDESVGGGQGKGKPTPPWVEGCLAADQSRQKGEIVSTDSAGRMKRHRRGEEIPINRCCEKDKESRKVVQRKSKAADVRNWKLVHRKGLSEEKGIGKEDPR